MDSLLIRRKGSQTLCSFFLIFHLLISCFYSSVSSQCTWKNPDTQDIFDLSPLIRDSSESDYKFNPSTGSSWYVNICGPASASCGGDVAVCYGSGTQRISCGVATDPVFGTPTIGEEGQVGVSIRYSGGQPCAGGNARQSVVNVLCFEDVEGLILNINEKSRCVYTVEMHSKYGCPINGTGGISGGGVFLLLFFLGGFLYLLIGMAWNVQRNGKSVGIEAIPNVEFWRDLPSLIKEGCFYSLFLVGIKKEKPQYAPMSDENKEETY